MKKHDDDKKPGSDDLKARRARSARIHAQIERLKKGGGESGTGPSIDPGLIVPPPPPAVPVDDGTEVPSSPTGPNYREFIERKMQQQDIDPRKGDT